MKAKNDNSILYPAFCILPSAFHLSPHPLYQPLIFGCGTNGDPEVTIAQFWKTQAIADQDLVVLEETAL